MESYEHDRHSDFLCKENCHWWKDKYGKGNCYDKKTMLALEQVSKDNLTSSLAFLSVDQIRP